MMTMMMMMMMMAKRQSAIYPPSVHVRAKEGRHQWGCHRKAAEHVKGTMNGDLNPQSSTKSSALDVSRRPST
jgi:hypothetical protein